MPLLIHHLSDLNIYKHWIFYHTTKNKEMTLTNILEISAIET